MKDAARRNIPDLIYLSSLYLWLAIYSFPMFFNSLSGNYRLIQTYNLDSMVMLRAVESALSSKYFHMTFLDYGHLYFNIAMALGSVYSLFLPLDDWTLFFILRLVALLGTYLTVTLVFVFARRFLGRIEAYFAAGAVAFTPALLIWSNEVKPDSLQMFLVTLSLYFCARAVEPTSTVLNDAGNPQLRNRASFVLAAAAAAGAAFSTKFLGIILFPLLAAAAVIVPAGRMSDRTFALTNRLIAWLAPVLCIGFIILGIAVGQQFLLNQFPSWTALGQSGLNQAVQLIRWGSFIAAGISLATAVASMRGFDFNPYRSAFVKFGLLAAVVFVFFAVFAVTSPWSMYRLQFVPVLHARNAILNGGEWFGFQWLPYLFGYADHDGNFIDKESGAFAILGSALILFALGRRQLSASVLPFVFVLGFVVIFATLLIMGGNRPLVLYALPFVPAFVLLAAVGLFGVRHALMRAFGERKAAIGCTALAALLVAAQIWHGTSMAMRYPNLVTALEPHNEKLGEWLQRCVPPATKILAASYTYVPPIFDSAIMADGYDNYNLFKPDLVILNLKLVTEVVKELETGPKTPSYETSDRKRFHEIVLHSNAWRPGPRFANFQVQVTQQLQSVMNKDCLSER